MSRIVAAVRNLAAAFAMTLASAGALKAQESPRLDVIFVPTPMHVVERMLEPPAQGPGVRIVYAFPGNRGTNTQYLRLTEEDRASLRRTLAGMR